MEQKIRILRLLEYTGTREAVNAHLRQRGVKQISPNGWGKGDITIRESFLHDGMDLWELPAPEASSDSAFQLAMFHLKMIDDKHLRWVSADHRDEFGPDRNKQLVLMMQGGRLSAREMATRLQAEMERCSEATTNPTD